MDDFDRFDEFERHLADALRSDADLSVVASEPAAVASAAVARVRRPASGAARLTIVGTTLRSPLAAAAVIGVLIVGGVLLLMQRGQPPVVGHPSPTPATRFQPQPSGRRGAESDIQRAGRVRVPALDGRVDRDRFDGHAAHRSYRGAAPRGPGPRRGRIPEDEPDLALASAELYDPATGTWSATGTMLRPAGGFQATLLRDGRVLVGDVDEPAADSPVFGAEVYDPVSGTWTATGKMVTHGGVATPWPMARSS